MPKLLPVQALRALAALAIAFLHAQGDAAALAARTGQAFAPLMGFPWTAGVDLFFVISGFIMVHASRALFGQAGAARTFLARRVARIVPLYWGVTSLYLAVALASPGVLNSGGFDLPAILASYLFWPHARPDGAVQPVYSLGWTLNYEMVFYLLFAAALGLSRRMAAFAVAAALVLLVVLGALLRPLPVPLAFWSDPIVLEFAFGVGLGAAFAEGLRLSTLARLALALGGLALLAVDLTRGGLLPRGLAHGVPAALLVAAAALGEGEGGAPARALARLGDASYALYLLHPFAIRGLGLALGAAGLAPTVGPWGFMALALTAAVLLSLAAHRWFERPATEIARRILEGRSARTPPSPVAARR